MATITNSLDWRTVESELNSQISRIGYNLDLVKMLHNIDSMVTKLSQLEVEARRTHKTQIVNDQLQKINDAIDRLEKLLLIGLLLK